MKFGKQLALLELPSARGHYVDYDALKRLAEQFLPPAQHEGDTADAASDDSVSATPRHTRVARAREVSSSALSAAGGASAARPANEEAILALAASGLDRAGRWYVQQLEGCRAAVAAAAAATATATALVAADALSCGCGAGGGAEGAGTAEGASAGAALGAALSAASSAVLVASALIDDVSGFAALNLAALHKAAKKFAKRWAALLPDAAPPPSIAPAVAALIAASPLADGSALEALAAHCAELARSMPPPLVAGKAPPLVSSGGAIGGGTISGGAIGGGSSPRAAGGGSGSGSSVAAPLPSTSASGVTPSARGAAEPLLVKMLDISMLSPGSVTRLRVRLAHGALDEPISVPVLVARGRHAGPTLGITAALHGNELAGIPVIHRLFKELDPETLSGTVVAIPVLNPIGFARYSRGFSDGQDLNRGMPGKKEGSASQQFAHAIMTRLVSSFDFLLDLHTASFGRVNSLYVRADMRDEHTHRLALLQRPQIIVHNSGPDGSLRGACAALGKVGVVGGMGSSIGSGTGSGSPTPSGSGTPSGASTSTATLSPGTSKSSSPTPCITIEIGDPQIIDPALTDKALRGVRNTLRYLKMAELTPDAATPGDADAPPVVVSRSFWLFSTAGGILTVRPPVAAWVKRGEVVAEIHSVWGDLVEQVVVTTDGIVVGKSTNPVCTSGDRILHLGVCEQSFAAKADDGHA